MHVPAVCIWKQKEMDSDWIYIILDIIRIFMSINYIYVFKLFSIKNYDEVLKCLSVSLWAHISSILLFVCYRLFTGQPSQVKFEKIRCIMNYFKRFFEEGKQLLTHDPVIFSLIKLSQHTSYYLRLKNISFLYTCFNI